MNKSNKIAIVVVIIIAFIVFTIVILNLISTDQEANFINELLGEAGTAINKPPKEYGDDFAAKIVGLLLYQEDIQLISPPNARPMEPVSLLFDHGKDGGKILDLQHYLDLNGSEYITIGIERSIDIKLRHKVQGGDYLNHWELIRKESNNNQTPFKRTYLFTTGRGDNKRIHGICFYEGTMIEIEFEGFVDDELIKKFETVTWNISKRIDSVYENHLRSISEGPLFANDPIITRPDLPEVE